MVGGDTEIGEHPGAGLDHQGRPAEIVFDGLGVVVTAQVFFQNNLMD